MGKKPMREGGPSMVEEDMELWAKEEGMTIADVKANINEELGCGNDYPKPTKKPKQIFLTPEKLDMMSKGWGMTVNETKKNICDMLADSQR